MMYSSQSAAAKRIRSSSSKLLFRFQIKIHYRDTEMWLAELLNKASSLSGGSYTGKAYDLGRGKKITISSLLTAWLHSLKAKHTPTQADYISAQSQSSDLSHRKYTDNILIGQVCASVPGRRVPSADDDRFKQRETFYSMENKDTRRTEHQQTWENISRHQNHLKTSTHDTT